jgi:hypothetical protein
MPGYFVTLIKSTTNQVIRKPPLVQRNDPMQSTV